MMAVQEQRPCLMCGKMFMASIDDPLLICYSCLKRDSGPIRQKKRNAKIARWIFFVIVMISAVLIFVL